MTPLVVLSALVITLVFLAVYTTTPAVRNQTEDTLHAYYEYSEGWSLGQKCHELGTGYIYNKENNPVDAVAGDDISPDRKRE